MKNFAQFVGIDWSGAKAPEFTRAIAVSHCKQGDSAPLLEPGPWSRTRVFEYLLALCNKSERTLVGIDANFGYSQQIGTSQFGDNYDYRNLWSAVEQSSSQLGNFFAGGFWQAWPEYFWTQGKKPQHITLPKRATEYACIEAQLGHPESPFKLIGAKQVGKGGLAAMRVAWRLKQEVGDAICIWPYEREIADNAVVVVSEIYPRQFLKRAGHGNTKVTTLAQLNAVLIALESDTFDSDNHANDGFSDHDTDAIVSAAGLRTLCGTKDTLPKTLSSPPKLSATAAMREGWIFGI